MLSRNFNIFLLSKLRNLCWLRFYKADSIFCIFHVLRFLKIVSFWNFNIFEKFTSYSERDGTKMVHLRFFVHLVASVISRMLQFLYIKSIFDFLRIFEFKTGHLSNKWYMLRCVLLSEVLSLQLPEAISSQLFWPIICKLKWPIGKIALLQFLKFYKITFFFFKLILLLRKNYTLPELVSRSESHEYPACL